ncbi:hypothetical protein LTS08_001077 [Lithohypha guttulata]|nr:hypothetical protein LTS08_001077 [Lithohypha guttulata]
MANQSTALKTSPISPLTNNYPTKTTFTPTQTPPGAGLMSNIYYSRDLSPGTDPQSSKATISLRLKLGILERHPYTTQTFCPFNYSTTPPPPSSSSYTNTQHPDPDHTYILIIVAPTLPLLSHNPPNPPDLANLRAFSAPLNDSTGTTSNIAVTYAPGTWHAPMIVLGSRRVDFLVTQFENGVGGDDCQEVLVGSGPDENVLREEERMKRGSEGLGLGEVEVDLGGLMGEKEDGWWGGRAKL